MLLKKFDNLQLSYFLKICFITLFYVEDPLLQEVMGSIPARYSICEHVRIRSECFLCILYVFIEQYKCVQSTAYPTIHCTIILSALGPISNCKCIVVSCGVRDKAKE
jgi:hypothetical protein